MHIVVNELRQDLLVDAVSKVAWLAIFILFFAVVSSGEIFVVFKLRLFIVNVAWYVFIFEVFGVAAEIFVAPFRVLNVELFVIEEIVVVVCQVLYLSEV